MLVSVYIFFPLVLTDLLDEKQQLVGIFRQYQRLKQEIVVQSLAVVFFFPCSEFSLSVYFVAKF